METVERLLAALGERLAPEPIPLERDYDPLHMQTTLRRNPEERLRLAISRNRLAGRLADEGAASAWRPSAGQSPSTHSGFSRS